MSRQPFTLRSNRTDLAVKPWEVGLLDRHMPWIDLAKRYLAKGTAEIAGGADNPEIVAFAKEIGQDWIKDDETPWCATFVGAMLKRSGFAHSGSARARSYLEVGNPLQEPVIGCVVVLWRGSPDAATGHVGFFNGWSEDGKFVYLLGGNQNDMVSVKRYAASKILGSFWPVPAYDAAPAQHFADSVQVSSMIEPRPSAAATIKTNVFDKVLSLGNERVAKATKGKKTLLGGIAMVLSQPAIAETLVNIGVPQGVFTDILPLVAMVFGGGGIASKLTDLSSSATQRGL